MLAACLLCGAVPRPAGCGLSRALHPGIALLRCAQTSRRALVSPLLLLAPPHRHRSRQCCCPCRVHAGDLSFRASSSLVRRLETACWPFCSQRSSPARLQKQGGRSVYPPRSQWRRRCSLRACPVLPAENDRPQTRPAVHSSRQPASSAACLLPCPPARWATTTTTRCGEIDLIFHRSPLRVPGGMRVWW